MKDDHSPARWLVLLYQFPSGPDSRRVRLWRRLQSIGAVAIKNSVYVLPFNEQSQEDFEWLLTELRSGGADGAILESSFVGGMTDKQIEALFNAARNTDYQELVDEIEAAISDIAAANKDDTDTIENGRRVLARARKRAVEVEAIDFFAADGRNRVEAAMQTLAGKTTGDDAVVENREKRITTELKELDGRVWVTRRGVGVDRVACAWLIRGWIDSDATFKFVASKGYAKGDGEIRFDMFEAEFTHEGDLCTFEVLARLVDENDAALKSVGEIVHDIDLKDARFGRPETEGVANLLAGIVADTDDDDERIARGGAMFDDLYRFFNGRTG